MENWLPPVNQQETDVKDPISERNHFMGATFSNNQAKKGTSKTLFFISFIAVQNSSIICDPVCL